MKPKIFITQVPHKRVGQQFVPVVNIAPAAEHGEVITMMPPSAPFFATTDLIEQLRVHLKDYNYKRGDALIALGDPAVIAAAAAVLGKDHGEFRILKWDRTVSKYLPASIKV
jgi:hypothetical protein